MSNVKKLYTKTGTNSRIKDLVGGLKIATNKEGDLCLNTKPLTIGWQTSQALSLQKKTDCALIEGSYPRLLRTSLSMLERLDENNTTGLLPLSKNALVTENNGDKWKNLNSLQKTKLESEKNYSSRLSQIQKNTLENLEENDTKKPFKSLRVVYIAEVREMQGQIHQNLSQVNSAVYQNFQNWLKNPDIKNLEQVGDWYKSGGMVRLRVDDSKYRIIFNAIHIGDCVYLVDIKAFLNKDEKSYKDIVEQRLESKNTVSSRINDFLGIESDPIIESKSKEPEFFFGKDGLNDWQHSYKGSDKFVLKIGEFRSGHPYTNLNQRIKHYFEKFGSPDFVHVINDEKSLALKAVYAEKGKDMIQLWSFVNIRQEAGWKAFEVAAQKSGYKIKRFSKGSIEDSKGYWLDGKEDGNMGESMENETVEIDNVDVMLSAIKELQAKAQSQEPEATPAPVDTAAVVVEPIPEVIQPSQTLPCVLSSRIHKSFTDVADDLFALGFMDTDLRIALSSCISDALIAFEMSVKEKCPQAEAILIDREAAEEVL